MPNQFALPLRKIAASLLLLLALTACDRMKKTTDAQDVAKAQESINKGDLRGGAILLQNALQKNPGNADAHRLLSELNLLIGNGEGAENELKRATDAGLPREAALPILAKALLLQGKFQDVLDRIDLPTQMDAKEGARLMAFRGDAWLGLGKADKAKADYEAASMLDAASAPAKVGFARLALAGNDVDKAAQLTREALAAEPGNGEFWGFQGQLDEARGDSAKAEESYGKAIELRRFNQFERARRVWIRLSLGKLDAAREDVKVLRRQFPDHFLTHFAQGLLFFKEQKLEDAQLEFEHTAKLNEGYVDAFYFLGVTRFLMGHLPSAQESLTRYNTLMPNTVRGTTMMALIRFKQNDLAEAAKLLLPVLEQFPDNVQALRLMGNIELVRGNNAKSLEYLGRAVEAGGRAAQAQAAGKADKGVGEVESALAVDPAMAQTEIQIVLIHLQAKEYAKAMEAVEAMKRRMPKSSLPFNLQAEVLVQQGEVAKAEAALKAALGLVPNDLGSLQSLAKLAIRGKQYDAARQYCQTALGVQPKDLPSRLCLAELDDLAGDQPGMIKELQQAIQDHPEVLGPRLALSRLYSRLGQAQRGLAVLEQARAKSGDNPEFLGRLVEAQLETDQAQAALESAGNLVKRVPRSAPAEYVLALAHSANGHKVEAREALQRALHNDPKYLPARIGFVKALAAEKKIAEAERDLKQLLEEYPGDPEVLGTKGWLAQRLAQWDAAEAAYRQALGKRPSSGETVIEVARSQWFGGNREGAVKTLGEWVDRHPGDIGVRHVLADFYGEMGKKREQVAEYEQAIAADPEDFIALNELAWAIRADAPAKALQYADRAVKLAPDSVPIFDTQMAVLIEQTEFERALGLLIQARKRWPDNTMVLYRLAVAQDKAGSAAQAIKTLRELLATHAGAFAERKDAEALLAKLTSR